jgi:hypothetical protein
MPVSSNHASVGFPDSDVEDQYAVGGASAFKVSPLPVFEAAELIVNDVALLIAVINGGVVMEK